MRMPTAQVYHPVLFFFQLYTLDQAGLSVEDIFYIFPKQVSNNVISQF